MNKQIDFWLPIILFTLAGLCIFLTERKDGGAIEGSMYGSTSAHGLVLAKNLMNSDQSFFMFSSKELQNGKEVYYAYNRFPLFPFLLTGIITSSFENNLNLYIYTARQLMNIFFFLSIIVAFKLVNEIVQNKYLALSAALAAFSSYYMLTYHNMIFNDIPALFGFVIALYCAAKSQKNKFKTSHILFYSLIPISMGWQPFAIFITWLLIDSLELLLEKNIAIKEKLYNLMRKPAFIITTIAIIWGVLILGLQLLNEWRIVGGDFADLPSVSSGLWRSGLVSAGGHTTLLWTFDWLNFLPGQAYSITQMLIPFWPIFQVEPGINASVVIVLSFIIYILLRYFKDKTLINKIHFIMIFSGLFWTIPMRHFVALHDFQSIFYVGFAISFFVILLSKFKLRAWNLLSVNITLVFIIAVSLTNYYQTPNSGVITKQFKNIQDKLPENSNIYFDGNRHTMTGFSRFTVDFFLSGCWFTEREKANYVISRNSNYIGKKITSNSDYNLFKTSDE